MSSTDEAGAFPTLPERVAHCLLLLNAVDERAELLQAGVSPRRVATLYPPEIKDLYPTLHAYLDAGKRVEFPSPGTMHSVKVNDEALHLYPEAVLAVPEAHAMLTSVAIPGRKVASRIMGYENKLIGIERQATFIARHSHIRTGLAYLERAFWYAGVCDFRDQQRVGYQLLRTTRMLLPELLPEGY